MKPGHGFLAPSRTLRIPPLRFVSLALAAGLALTAAGALAAPPAKPAPDMSLGSPRAKIVVEEYASLSCSHCAVFNNEVFPAFRAKYLDTGKVRYVMHEFITPPEQVAAAAWVTARCAPADKYFTAVDSFFRAQAELYKSGDLKAAILTEGKAAGLEEPAIMACLNDPAQVAGLNARVKAGIDRGVNATPTFYVNGVKAGEGEMTLADLDKAIAKPPAKATKKK
jgi:protein-disulfide isomerase